MRVTLPNVQDFIDRRMAAYDAVERQRVDRQVAEMNQNLAERGIFSSGGAAEMERRIREESDRRRQEFQLGLETEAERQRQLNARDQFTLNAEEAGRERQFDLSRYGLGEQQAGRIGQNILDVFRAARAAGEEERQWALNQRAQDLQAQGQSFDQAIRQATTEQAIAEGQQRIGLNQFNAQLQADQQRFQQTLAEHVEGRATQQQLEDSAVKFFQADRQARQQDFDNEIKRLTTTMQLTQAEAAEVRAAYQMALDYRKNEQDVMLKLIQIASQDENTRIAEFNKLMATSGSLVESALNRYVDMYTRQTSAQAENAGINAATQNAQNQRTGSIFSNLGGVLEGLF